MVEFPEALEIDKQIDLSIFDNGRYEEIVQMLSDLGYLCISAENGNIVDTADLKNAVSLFRKEAISVALISKSSDLLPFPENPKENHNGILTYREYSVLQLLVSLDGDFTLKPVAQISHIPIYIRVLQYRLHLLGLLAERPNGVYSSHIQVALEQLSEWIPPSTQIKLHELTGNLYALIVHIKNSDTLKTKMIYFKMSPTKNLDCTPLHRHAAFIQQFEKDHSISKKEYKILQKPQRVLKKDATYFEKQCNNSDARFIVRLMQLSQWISGYYLGKIDGDLGELTYTSFCELANGEAELENTDFNMDRFMTKVHNNFWAINPCYFFAEATLFSTNENSTINKVFELYKHEYSQLNPSQKTTVNQNLTEAWKSVNINFSNDLKSSQNRFRRIYQGAKSMLNSFWKGIKNIFNTLKQKVVDLSSGLFNLVKNFAKFLYREIREAVQIFGRGLCFLFGDRAITSEKCLTKFDLDMDSITHFELPLSPEIIQQHRQMLVEASTGLTFCLTLTARIMHVAITTGFAWPKLLLEAGVLLKQLVKECYNNKSYIGFKIDPQGA